VHIFRLTEEKEKRQWTLRQSHVAKKEEKRKSETDGRRKGNGLAPFHEIVLLEKKKKEEGGAWLIFCPTPISEKENGRKRLERKEGKKGKRYSTSPRRH